MNAARVGAASALGAVVFFSTIDTGIKFLSDSYALHQVVLIRSLIGLVFIMAVIAPFTGGLSILRTQRLGLHILRGLMVVTANLTFFLGLASMPLAEGVAIFFISPLLITAFSVIFLGERVGPRRWAAIAVGLLGVLIILRPGTEAFRPVSLLPLLAATAYAGLHMMTRVIGKTDSAATMSVYILLVFIGVCLIFGAVLGDGKFAGAENPSLAFLLRPWGWPEPRDWLLLIWIGIATAMGGYLISHAYRVAEAAVVAPFEYIALPLSILWGWLIFGEVPDVVAFAGIALILTSGLFVIWRDQRTESAAMVDAPRTRRS
ncbi:MAG: DMT family transporter [Shimia sp.]